MFGKLTHSKTCCCISRFLPWSIINWSVVFFIIVLTVNPGTDSDACHGSDIRSGLRLCVHMHYDVCCVSYLSTVSSSQLCVDALVPAVGGCLLELLLFLVIVQQELEQQSAKLARWVWLISINCGNATQPLAALCRNNQIITYTLSQGEACLSGHAVEREAVKGVSCTFCHTVLYYHYCISLYILRLLAKFLTPIRLAYSNSINPSVADSETLHSTAEKSMTGHHEQDQRSAPYRHFINT